MNVRRFVTITTNIMVHSWKLEHFDFHAYFILNWGVNYCDKI
jgi:hypothetical protein